TRRRPSSCSIGIGSSPWPRALPARSSERDTRTLAARRALMPRTLLHPPRHAAAELRVARVVEPREVLFLEPHLDLGEHVRQHAEAERERRRDDQEEAEDARDHAQEDRIARIAIDAVFDERRFILVVDPEPPRFAEMDLRESAKDEREDEEPDADSLR